MKNYPDAFSPPGCGSSCTVAEAQTTLDPMRFLELGKNETIYKLVNELGYSQEEACLEYNAMTGIIVRLKLIRDSQSQTDDLLKDTIIHIRYRAKLFVIVMLLNATEHDDTYCYAYNTLVYYANRYLHINLSQKKVREADLLVKLDAEKRSFLPVLSHNPPVFDETLLNAFYLAFDNCIWEHTTHADFMNWFRKEPAGKPVFRNKMTTYFCYAVGKIEDRMIQSRRPKNLNLWIGPLINGNNYSRMKRHAGNKKILAEIDNKLSMF